MALLIIPRMDLSSWVAFTSAEWAKGKYLGSVKKRKGKMYLKAQRSDLVSCVIGFNTLDVSGGRMGNLNISCIFPGYFSTPAHLSDYYWEWQRSLPLLGSHGHLLQKKKSQNGTKYTCLGWHYSAIDETKPEMSSNIQVPLLYGTLASIHLRVVSEISGAN
ncbi:hypothetical protein H5410_056923 [Solanum commersonii]|uniref:Uncharacterized protein n=1 Tax=Solanum commersonii TaxID=4109 RepID=A0A9J5WN64_SOLCO|nr:hypothetical protein H5410_056923 [Solanum commersonii]